jgi:hypothetical protein
VKLLWLMPLLLVRPDDVDTQKTDLMAGVANTDRFVMDRAGKALEKLSQERCPEVMLQAYKAGLELLAKLDKELKKYEKEMETWQVVKDKDGRVLKGDAFKYFQAKRFYDPLYMKTEALQSGLPQLMAHLSRLKAPCLEGLVAALSYPEWLARAASADALAKIDHEAALAALMARAKVEDVPGVKVALADALGAKISQKEVEIQKLLMPWTSSPFWQIRLATAQALARSGDRNLVPTYTGMLKGASGRMKYEINEILRNLTHVDKHGDHEAWRSWWEKNKDEFLEGKYIPEIAERSDLNDLTTFYGIPVHSTRVVFLIDVSLSMNDPTSWKPPPGEETDQDKLESDKAVDVAKFELKKIIKKLPENSAFNVIGIWANLTMLDPKQMVILNKVSRESSIKFVQGMQTKVGTDIFAAFQRAFDFSGGQWNAPLREDSIDSIYILSDGVPSVGMSDRQQLVERVANTARYKKILVHCVAIDPPAHGLIVMKGLAAGTGGLFVQR